MKRLFAILDARWQAAGAPARRVARAVKSLSDAYRDGVARGYMADDAVREAYLFYFMPLNVFKCLAILHAHPALAAAQRWYDFGCGPLSMYAALALSDADPVQLHADDADSGIVTAGTGIVTELRPDWKGRILAGRPAAPVDVAAAANVLTEIGDGGIDRELPRLAGSTSGHLLLVEPGTRDGFARLQAVRDRLPGLGLAPVDRCPCDPCPMTGRDWCHESLRFPRPPFMQAIEQHSGLDNRFVNFCYLLAARPGVETERTFDDVRHVVSGVLETKGEYTLHLCGPDGVVPYRLMKRDLRDGNRAFAGAGRGDLLRIDGIDDRGAFRRLGEESRVTLVSRFGVPDDSA